jgi:hypothetical protein
MKDIKERVRDKNPKIRNPAARLPKELVRSAVLEAKEKPRELHEKSSGQSESPTQYGTEKIESVQYRAASVAGKSIGKTTYQGGKKLAGVTYRKIKERKSRQEEAKAAEEAMEQGAESGKKLIKLKPEQAALAKENGKRQVKAAPRVVKVSGLSQKNKDTGIHAETADGKKSSGDAESKSSPDGKKVSTGIGRKWKSSPSGNWKGFKVIRTGNYSSDSKRGSSS